MSEAWDNLVQGLKDAFASVGTTLGEWIPRILVAVLVLIVGRWLLRTLRTAIERLLETSAVTAVFDKAGITAALAPSQRKASSLVAGLAYAFLMLLLWLVIFRVLQIEPIESLLERLIAVIPLILVAAALVIIAAAVGNFVADLVRPYSVEKNVSWLPSVVRILIVVAGALAALDLLEITFAEDLVKIAAATVGIAFAVAFGIGGIDTAKGWWGRYLAPRDSADL
jgi:cellobiose-specific phosphotransferase system component IIC